MTDDGLWMQWRKGALVIRSLSHLAAAAESTHGRPLRLRGVLLGYSVCLDAWVATRARTSRHRGLPEVLLGVADAAAWSGLTRDDPVHLRTLAFAGLAPNLMETAFRLRAGTTAVPVIQPPIPWESPVEPFRRQDVSRLPTSRDARIALRRSARLVGAMARDAAPTLAAMMLVRHRRGLRVGAGPIGWSVAGATGGFFLARIRDRAQADTTRVWQERTDYLITEARVRSRVQSALVHNVTDVDPKALLTFLERAGSDAATSVLDATSQSATVAVGEAAELGITLAAAVDLRTITPSEYRTRWVPQSQVRVIRDEMARIDAQLEASGDDALDDALDDDEVVIESADAQMLVLTYRGHRIEAAQPVPDLAIRLEPTLWPVVASALLNLLTVLPSNEDRPSYPALAIATVLHTIEFVRLLGKPTVERRADRTTALLTLASTLVLDVSIGRNRIGHRADPITGELIEEGPGTSATQAIMFLLGTSWNDLRDEAPWMLGAATLGWLYSLRIPKGRSLHSFISEASFLFMPLFANLGAGTHSRSEAELLDEALQQRLSATIIDTARAEARDAIDQFLAQLECVISELPRLHPGLDDDEVAQIVQNYRAEADRIASTDPLDLIGW